MKISKQQAESIGNKLKVDWKKTDIEQFRMGLEVEQEHGSKISKKFDVTHGDLLTVGKIALAHLDEDPKYYTKLKKMEEAAYDISDVSNVCQVDGSSHVLATCKIGKDKYYLKFSEEDLFFNTSTNPSLQILVEYLAYKIYSLYPGVSTPSKIHLVFDKSKQAVGIATSQVKGKMAYSVSPEKLGKLMSAGVFVDILLANWDVIGMGVDNVIIQGSDATRLDPGGALTFRARGQKKNTNFGTSASELKTMLDPNFGSGEVFQYSDIKKAADVFASVSWSTIAAVLKKEYQEIASKLKKYQMNDLLQQWNQEFKEIYGKLQKRHKTIAKHVQTVLKENATTALLKQIIKEEIRAILNATD